MSDMSGKLFKINECMYLKLIDFYHTRINIFGQSAQWNGDSDKLLLASKEV